MPPKRPAQKSNAKKRAAPSDSISNNDSDASNSPNKEKPSKRPRTSTTSASDVSAKGTSVTASTSDDEDDDVEAAPAPSSKSAAKSKPAPKEIVQPKLVGAFDLYGMTLPFLNKVYCPGGGDAMFPEELYKAILTYQAKNDRTAKITIPEDFADGEPGTFYSGIFRDPMEEIPFDIAINNIEDVDGSKLDLDLEYDRPEDDWNGLGLEADLELEEGGCGIASSSGAISMRPLWRKVDKDGKASELFEGTFTFKATYSYLYSKRGHGKGQELSLAFWAVRAKV